MPEGPEIKNYAEQMALKLNGQTVTHFLILKGKYLNKKNIPNLDLLLEKLPLTVVKVGAKGKFIYLVLENGMAIGLGFGMTGRVYFSKVEQDPDCHVQLLCQSGTVMCFEDTRQFGNFVVYPDPVSLEKRLSQLGIDIITENPSRDEVLAIFASKKRWNICKLLMDQSLFAGIGNYIKCESLYRCRIHPLAQAGNLTSEQQYELFQTCQDFARQSYQLSLSYGSDKYELFHVYNQKVDPNGYKVVKIKTPDGRTTSYVFEIQTIGHDFIK